MSCATVIYLQPPVLYFIFLNLDKKIENHSDIQEWVRKAIHENRDCDQTNCDRYLRQNPKYKGRIFHVSIHVVHGVVTVDQIWLLTTAQLQSISCSNCISKAIVKWIQYYCFMPPGIQNNFPPKTAHLHIKTIQYVITYGSITVTLVKDGGPGI